MMNYIRGNQRKKGIALLVALTLSILLSLITGAILAGAIALRELTSNPLDSILRHYLVELGKEDAIARLRAGTITPPAQYNITLNIQGRSYTITVDVAQIPSTPTFQITVGA